MVRSSLLAAAAALGVAAPAGAATLSVDEGGTVSYTAAAGEANRVVVTFAGSESVTISDEDRPLAAPAGCSALDARSVRCDDIADVRADLGDGDDVLRHEGTAGPLSVFGGPGQDHLMGGAGADYLVGGTDVDTIEGGAGSDRIEAALGLDVVDCGAGTDRIEPAPPAVVPATCERVLFYVDADRSPRDAATLDAHPVALTARAAAFRLRCPTDSVNDFGEYTPCDGKLQLNETSGRHRTVGSARFDASGERAFVVRVPLRRAVAGPVRVTVHYTDVQFAGLAGVPSPTWTIAPG